MLGITRRDVPAAGAGLNDPEAARPAHRQLALARPGGRGPLLTLLVVPALCALFASRAERPAHAAEAAQRLV